MSDKTVTIDYTNYRGETELRDIVPETLRFGATQWHPEPQWLIRAWDLDRKDFREFAVKDIHSWKSK